MLLPVKSVSYKTEPFLMHLIILIMVGIAWGACLYHTEKNSVPEEIIINVCLSQTMQCNGFTIIFRATVMKLPLHPSPRIPYHHCAFPSLDSMQSHKGQILASQTQLLRPSHLHHSGTHCLMEGDSCETISKLH